MGKACSIHGAKQKVIRISAVKHNGNRPLLRGKLKSGGDLKWIIHVQVTKGKYSNQVRDCQLLKEWVRRYSVYLLLGIVSVA